MKKDFALRPIRWRFMRFRHPSRRMSGCRLALLCPSEVLKKQWTETTSRGLCGRHTGWDGLRILTPWKDPMPSYFYTLEKIRRILPGFPGL